MSLQEIAAVIDDVIEGTRAARPHRAALIGVAGAQGSGKTSVCRLLEAANRPRFAHFSLDDVYLTRMEREQRARELHPLFVTRGPPGTHDLDLADRVISALLAASPDTETPLPRFDKARDDRAPVTAWPVHVGRPEAILVDGWCLGALPDDLGDRPINRLESEEDADGRWRSMVRAELEGRYRRFFERFDAIVYLRPPDWEIVRAWRAQQEAETLGRALTREDEARLDRFLEHYERLTRSMMAGRRMPGPSLQLDRSRRVVSVDAPPNPLTSPP